MTAHDPLMSSIPDPIVYGRPRFLVGVLSFVAGAVAVTAIISYLTYGRVDTASTNTVLGNRAVTEKLAADEQRREVEDHAHRLRNEEAHACLIWLDQRILRDLHDPVTVNVAANPCNVADPFGDVPPVVYPTTTTRPKRTTTTTTAPRTRRQPTTTTTRATTTTTSPPRCPHNTLPVAGVCRPVDGP